MYNVNDILAEHVTLVIESLDRIYLNGYIPRLQLPGQLVDFLVKQKGHPIPSPVLLRKITADFVAAVKDFATQHNIPLVDFERGERKDDVAAEYRQQYPQRDGVNFIGIAQEKATAFKANKKEQHGYVGFDYSRQPVFVNHFYFYLTDDDFGPAFIKICTYAPYPIRVCLNGHEWAKRQCEKAGIAYQSLDNGFLSTDQPERLQQICQSLGQQQIEAFFYRWLDRLPFPLSKEDREQGYQPRLSVWQLEVSLTHVFSRPLKGREFFEAVIRDNLDLGRPDRVQLLFDRRIMKSTPGLFRTRVIQNGVHPSLHIEYKNTDIKQYFKENRALRTETTFNDSKDFGVGKDISNLDYLRQIGQNINRRLLEVQRVSQNCAFSQESLERVVRPTVADGQRAPGLKFGDPRTMALFAALCLFTHFANGFTNRELRAQVADLLGLDLASYTIGKMTYDLRRLRLKGILYRIPRSNRYRITSYGIKVSTLFTKLQARIFQPGFATLDQNLYPVLPNPLRKAFDQVNKEIDRLIDEAAITLKKAA